MLQFSIGNTIAIALTAFFLAALPARGAGKPRPPNVVLLIVDDLRADRLGAYGGKLRTPNFDALARESVVFERAYSQAGWTLPSVSSILTGLYPTTHGVRRSLPEDWPMRKENGTLRLKPGNSLPPDRLTMARAFHERGYRTEAVVSCPFCPPEFGFGSGFDRYDASGGLFRDVNDDVARRLQSLRDGKPFFLYVHVIDAHLSIVEDPFPHPEDAAKYDAQVSSTDAGFGALMDLLREAGLLGNTVLAVTADHGEEFGDHGLRGHGDSPYQTALRVPLMIRLPGGKTSRRAPAPVQTIDLFPTLLELSGLKPAPGVQGVSLAPAVRGLAVPERTVYTEIYPHRPGDSDALTAVVARTKEWRYIWRPDGDDELYRIESDPGETKNLVKSEPALAARFRARTDAWREKVRLAGAALGAPAETPAALPAAEAERLRRAGYLSAPAPRPEQDLAALGLQLATRTRDLLPAFDRSGLNCASCHLDAGRRPGSAPWAGLAAVFPVYFPRDDRTITLSDRISDCFRRSLNGEAPAAGSREMRALEAYIGSLPVPKGPHARGFPKLAAAAPPDPKRGSELYAARCARCHGRDGQGADGPDGAYLYPPLWGARSFNIGASMARTGPAAAFIRRNMPKDGPATLSDQEAWDVAEFVTHQPRPDYPGKAADWPKGGRPADAR